MHRNMFFWIVVVMTALCGLGSVRAAERKPNFVVILIDDMGYNDLGCYGSSLIQTPHIDRLAVEGTKFTGFYAQNVCGPSRAAIMTGSYPIRVAEPGNAKRGHTVPHSEEITLAETLKAAGYTTGCIGKWHLAGLGAGEHGRGTGPYPTELMPNAQGFDYFFGTPAHNGFTRQPDPKRWKTELYRNTELLEQDTNMNAITQRETDEAIGFIRRSKDKPFFCYMAYNMVHAVLGASDTFRGKSLRGLYGDAIMEIDHGVGQIVATLKQLGIDDNTVIVLTSDNGPWIDASLGDHGGCAYPLRGFKMNAWDGGSRVPGLVNWPDHVPAGRVTDELCTTMDLYATFANLAGAKLPTDRALDSLDMTDFWLGHTDRSPRDTYCYYSYTFLQAVRRGDWKLVVPRPQAPNWTLWYARHIDGVDGYELYNIKTDLSELHNVAADHPDVVAELKQLYESARTELGDYNLVGTGDRFFDPNPPAPGSRRPFKPGNQSSLVINTKLSTGAGPVDFKYATALTHEPSVTRRDPSDVIKVGDAYYVWYTKVVNGPDIWQYPSGYSGDVYYATSTDGRRFTEQGIAVGKGDSGEWDEHGVFTPNILKWNNKFYLYYTGVPRPFDENTPTGIGVAVADSPNRPWKKYEYNPVLKPDFDDPEAFDSMRVDDAVLVARHGQVWFYYKGRCVKHGKAGPGKTRMGVATSGTPLGPFVRSVKNPLHRGHEVLVWPQGYGVGSMATNAGPRQLYYAYDGLHFVRRNLVHHPPGAPGLYRADDFRDNFIADIPRWGVSMRKHQGDIHLDRFDIIYDDQ